MPYTPFPPLSAQDPLGTKQQSHPPWKLEVAFKCFHFPCFHHVLTGDGKACSNGPMFERGVPTLTGRCLGELSSPPVRHDMFYWPQAGRQGSDPYWKPALPFLPINRKSKTGARGKDCVSRAATLPMEMEEIQQFHPERKTQQIKSHKGPEHAVYRIIWHGNLKAAS